MKLIFALLLSLVPLAAATAEAPPEWSLLGTDNDGTDIYVRTDDMLKGRPTHTQAMAWIKLDHSKDSSTSLRESKILVEINCPAQTFRRLSSVNYQPDGSSNTDTPTYAKTDYITPETTIFAVAKIVCADVDD